VCISWTIKCLMSQRNLKKRTLVKNGVGVGIIKCLKQTSCWRLWNVFLCHVERVNCIFVTQERDKLRLWTVFS